MLSIIMLQERQRSILNAAVEEYIRTARPVASRELAREFDLQVSPATIRNELLELDELGYLEQPHTSAGRIPTDKGYRFFVDYLLADAELEPEEDAMLRRAFAVRDAQDFVREFAKTVSRIAGAFTAAGVADEEFFYETGFREILSEPEFADPEEVRAFGRLADFLDERIGGLLPHLAQKEERIWIGVENPWKEARQYTVMLSSWAHPAGFSGFVSIIAPKRTNYSKHKAVIEHLHSGYDA